MSRVPGPGRPNSNSCSLTVGEHIHIPLGSRRALLSRVLQVFSSIITASAACRFGCFGLCRPHDHTCFHRYETAQKLPQTGIRVRQTLLCSRPLRLTVLLMMRITAGPQYEALCIRRGYASLVIAMPFAAPSQNSWPSSLTMRLLAGALPLVSIPSRNSRRT